MRLKSIFLLALITGLYGSATAQRSDITDSELLKYAIATDSLKTLTDQYKTFRTKLANDPNIPAGRQQQLAQTQGDSLKLVQIKATAYEKTYLKRVQDERNRETLKFQNAYSSLINDFVGTDTFSKINARLKTEAKLKHRLDSVTRTLQPKIP